MAAAAAWAWHPAEAAAPGKGAQGTLSASLAAAARRAYMDSRTCLQMAILTLEELFKGLQGFKLTGLHHSEIRYCSYCGGAQHWVWANWKWFTFFFFPSKISFQLDLRHSVQSWSSVSRCLFGGYCCRLCPFQVLPPNIIFSNLLACSAPACLIFACFFLGKAAHQTTRICHCHLPQAGPWAGEVAAGCRSPKEHRI